MIVEVIAVGTELLIGEIVNSNTAIIGQRLAENGFDAHYQVVVGDNQDRLVAAIRQATERADAVLITGGIGPTQDDLTREALCELADVVMTRDEEHAAWIERRIRAQGRKPAANVFRMADLPRGSAGIPNSNGAALGVAMEIDGTWVFAMPGVQAEMSSMLTDEVMPRLRRLDRQPAVLKSKVIHTWGHGESAVAEMLGDLFESVNPSVAFLIRDMEVRVRISAKAANEAEAAAMIEPFEVEIRRRLGDAVFATDDETVEQIVVGLLRQRGWRLATTEIATLGRIGARVAAVSPPELFVGSLIGEFADFDMGADVTLHVGEIGPDSEIEDRTTRPVRMTAVTPEGAFEREFQFGGDDERVRSFATYAGLHLIRTSIGPGAQRT